jgi:hypothetical protein
MLQKQKLARQNERNECVGAEHMIRKSMFPSDSRPFADKPGLRQ